MTARRKGNAIVRCASSLRGESYGDDVGAFIIAVHPFSCVAELGIQAAGLVILFSYKIREYVLFLCFESLLTIIAPFSYFTNASCERII